MPASVVLPYTGKLRALWELLWLRAYGELTVWVWIPALPFTGHRFNTDLKLASYLTSLL